MLILVVIKGQSGWTRLVVDRGLFKCKFTIFLVLGPVRIMPAFKPILKRSPFPEIKKRLKRLDKR